MMLRHLLFILLVANVPGESTSTVQNASLAREKSQSFGLSDAVLNTQIFTMFLYKDRQVSVYSPLSNGASLTLRNFYYMPVVMAELGRDLNGNLSTAWIVGNDVRVNVLLGSPEINELARRAVMKKHKRSVAKYAKHWEVSPLIIDSLTAYIVKEDSNPVEGVHPFSIVHPDDLIINVSFLCSTREKAELALKNILDGIYNVEVAFFFGGFRKVSTKSVAIKGAQLKNVFSKAVADGGNTKALYLHRSQSSKFVDTCISNFNIEDQDQRNDLIEQFTSLLQQGIASVEQTIIDAKQWDQVWSPANINPDLITRELNNNFTYNEDETRKHNFSDIYFDWKTGSSSSSTDKGSFNFVGVNLGKSNEKNRSNSQEDAQVVRQISSLTDIKHDLNKRHLQVEWTGKKLIPKSFSVVRLTDLKDTLQAQLLKKNLTAEKARGAIVHTLKGLHKSDIDDSMAAMCKNESKAEIEKIKKRLDESNVEADELKNRLDESKEDIDEIKKRLDDAKQSQNSFIDVIKQMNVSLQKIKAKSKTEIDQLKKRLDKSKMETLEINKKLDYAKQSQNNFMDIIKQMNASLQEIKTKSILPAATSTPSTSEDSATPTKRGIQLFEYSAEARERAEVEEFGGWGLKSNLCSASGLFSVDIREQKENMGWEYLWKVLVKGEGGRLWWFLMMPKPADNLVVYMHLVRRNDTLLIQTSYRKSYEVGNPPPQFTIDCKVSLIIGNKDGTSTTRTQRKQYQFILIKGDGDSDFVTFTDIEWGVIDVQKIPTVKIQLIDVKV